MAKQPSSPIMPKESERFMAFTGLIQWANGVVSQGRKTQEAKETLARMCHPMASFDNERRRKFTLLFDILRCEHHHFVVAANKFYEYRGWAAKHGDFSSIDFSPVENCCSVQTVKHLRNMREHVIDYFEGKGNNKEGWWATEESNNVSYSTDASSCLNTKIGGRLCYVTFAQRVQSLLPALLKEPIPSPLAPRSMRDAIT